jgi:hypothetical protein
VSIAFAPTTPATTRTISPMPSAGPFNPYWVATYRSQHGHEHRHAHMQIFTWKSD